MSFVEENHDHRLVIEEIYEEDGLVVELAVEHPPTCLEIRHYEGRFGDQAFFTVDRLHCYLHHQIAAVGIREALILTDSDDFARIISQFVTTGRDSLRLHYKASGGFDYWGEYDEELEWWVW